MCSAFLVSGCFLWTSAEQGASLERRIGQCEERLNALESTAAGFTARMESAASKVKELESVLEQATQLLTRNSADTGARVDELEARLQMQAGLLDELRFELSRLSERVQAQERDYEKRMKQFARRAGVDLPVEDSEIPAQPDEHFRAALSAYELRDFSLARALFRAFITRYPNDARVDDAIYLIGRSYLSEDRPATALNEFRRILNEHRNGDQVPQTLLAMGEAFLRLKECRSAREAYEGLIQAYQRTPQAGEARTRLREIERLPQEYCRER